MTNISYQELKPPHRILLGPGPSNVHPRVQTAMTESLVGHTDPYFYNLMTDTMKLLRFIFRTENELTHQRDPERCNCQLCCCQEVKS